MASEEEVGQSLASISVRLDTLEQRIGLGLFNFSDVASIQDDIKLLKDRTSRAVAMFEVGNAVYGGPVRTYTSPSAYSLGPFREALDASFDIDFDIVIPVYILRILKCTLRIKPIPIRNPALVATSASGTETSGAGGGQTSSSGGSHTHSLSGAVTSESNHAHTGGTSSDSPSDPHSHLVITDADGGHNHSVSGATAASGGSHSHTVSNHDHTIPAHGHNLTLGISEGGSATTIRFHIDGVDRTAALGGPWSAAVSVDITPYLLNVRGEPVHGVHPVKFESASVGAIEVWIDFYVIAKVPVG